MKVMIDWPGSYDSTKKRCSHVTNLDKFLRNEVTCVPGSKLPLFPYDRG